MFSQPSADWWTAGPLLHDILTALCCLLYYRPSVPHVVPFSAPICTAGPLLSNMLPTPCCLMYLCLPVLNNPNSLCKIKCYIQCLRVNIQLYTNFAYCTVCTRKSYISMCRCKYVIKIKLFGVLPAWYLPQPDSLLVTTHFIYMHHDSWYMATDPDCFKLVLVLVEISYFPLFNDNGSGWL